jgi:hypothetical protein
MAALTEESIISDMTDGSLIYIQPLKPSSYSVT